MKDDEVPCIQCLIPCHRQQKIAGEGGRSEWDCPFRGGGGVGGGRLRKGTLEGEQQAIMSTRPLPFKPSYNSLVSVLSLYGITGGTELQHKHTCLITVHCHCHCHCSAAVKSHHISNIPTSPVQ